MCAPWLLRQLNSFRRCKEILVESDLVYKYKSIYCKQFIYLNIYIYNKYVYLYILAWSILTMDVRVNETFDLVGGPKVHNSIAAYVNTS